MKRWADQQGFTLLEILISAATFAVVVVAVLLMYSTNHATFNRGQRKVEVQQTARVGMWMLANEIRTAGYDPSNVMNLLPTTAVQAMNPNTITFIADVDGDNITDRVTYRLQGAQLVRDFASWNGAAFPAPVPGQLADGVSALTFTYFDGNDNAAVVPADIRRITIGLTIQQTGVGGQQTFPLTMDVRLRNLQ